MAINAKSAWVKDANGDYVLPITQDKNVLTKNGQSTVETDLNNKAEKTYVDQQIANVADGTPKGTYSTLVDLQTAFPTGTTGIYIIQADGNWYYWDGSSWLSGGVYQTSGIADGAVTTSKLSNPNKKVRLFVSATVPNYDTTTKTLDFNSTSPQATLLYGDNYYNIPVGTTVENTIVVTSASKLVFNVNSKIFTFIAYDTVLNSDEVLIFLLRTNPQGTIYPTANFPMTFDGKMAIPDESIGADKLSKPSWDTFLYVSPTAIPNYDTTTKTLDFNSLNPYAATLVYGQTNYYLIPEGTTVVNNLSTTSVKLVFDTVTKLFRFIAYNEVLSSDEVAVLALRTSISTYGNHVISNFPTTIDGVFVDAPSKPVIKNPLNANVKAIAHRGYSTIAPENTIASYKLASEKGYTYVECDIAFTSDGIPVLLHDSTIDRTSNGTGNVVDLTLAELKLLDFGSWKSTIYADERIPTLNEFIIVCKKFNFHPYLELKTILTTDQATSLVNIVRRAGMLKNCTWISFTANNLILINQNDSKARIGLSIGIGLSTEAINSASVLKTNDNDVFVFPYYTPISEAIVSESLDLDIPVEVWTVNNAVDINNLVESGVSGIFTDLLNVAEIMMS